jgi:serine phosphatase RsbU (regulator of sigma subunit)
VLLCPAQSSKRAVTLRQRERCATELWATGMPLGMLPGSRYEEHEATIAPGECLLFYSDGLVEAHSLAKEMFGFPRLQKVLEERDGEASLIETLLVELHRFTGEGWEQEDDVTMVTLQRTPGI